MLPEYSAAFSLHIHRIKRRRLIHKKKYKLLNQTYRQFRFFFLGGGRWLTYIQPQPFIATPKKMSRYVYYDTMCQCLENGSDQLIVYRGIDR